MKIDLKNSKTMAMALVCIVMLIGGSVLTELLWDNKVKELDRRYPPKWLRDKVNKIEKDVEELKGNVKSLGESLSARGDIGSLYSRKTKMKSVN